MESRLDENGGPDLFGVGSNQFHRNIRSAAPTHDDRRLPGDVIDELRRVAGVDPYVWGAVRRPAMPTAVVTDDLVGAGEGILNVSPNFQHPKSAMDEQNRRTVATHLVGDVAALDRKDL
jgi:hypothetical protein